MRKFITSDRNKEHLMPVSIDEWLPEKHLARFVVEILEQLGLSAVGTLANAHYVDTQELLPVLDAIPAALGKVGTAAADNGYFSQDNIQGCVQREVEPYIAVGKQAHNQWLDQQLAKQELEPPSEHASPSKQMSHKLKTGIGRAIYRLRKMTVEPVFGIIKEIMGFRWFSLRGQEAANGEWLLVCSAFNLKRLFVLANA